jgi:hypothetical protein
MGRRTRGPIGGNATPVWIVGQTEGLDVSGETLVVVLESGVLTSITNLVGIDDGLAATRAGRGVCKWVNALTPGAAEVVLTTAMAPLLTYNLSPGERVMVTQYCYGVDTTSDDCDFEFGYTDQPDGAGTFYPVGPHKHIATGAANQGRESYDQEITPPEAVKYADGARCITFRVDCNDASCEVTMGWHGWSEDDD